MNKYQDIQFVDWQKQRKTKRIKKRLAKNWLNQKIVAGKQASQAPSIFPFERESNANKNLNGKNLVFKSKQTDARNWLNGN